ncbi:MAG: hypothetical protein Q8P58_00525 [Candidatus Adlerbacteria bacterium]|nr:hypothetical protein [Candidatus Adlerbacteria bacterium]
MNTRFNAVFKELNRFDLVYSHLGVLRKDVNEIKKEQQAHGEILQEMNMSLDSMAKAIDKDAVTIIDHETRIRKLERAR